jgi:hypothetical protein
MQTYDPKKVIVSALGNAIGGFAPGTFIKVSRAEDAFMLTVGSDGIGTRTKNANRSGTIEITLMASSPLNDVLQAAAILDDATGNGVGPMQIKDLKSVTSLVHAANCWIKKLPDFERAKELGEITWTLESDDIEIVHGGIVG